MCNTNLKTPYTIVLPRKIHFLRPNCEYPSLKVFKREFCCTFLFVRLRFFLFAISTTGKRVLTKFMLVPACSKMGEVKSPALECTLICRFPCEIVPYRYLLLRNCTKNCSWKDSSLGEVDAVQPACDESAPANQAAWKCCRAHLDQEGEAGWILLESTVVHDLLKHENKTRISWKADKLGTKART